MGVGGPLQVTALVIRGCDPRKGQDLFLCYNTLRSDVDRSSLSFNWNRPSSPEVKRLRREVYHSVPSNAKFKNEWSYNSAPPVSLHNVIRDKFIFTIIRNIPRYTWQLVFAFFTKQVGVFK